MPRKVLSTVAVLAAMSMVAAACSKPAKLKTASGTPSATVPDLAAPVGQDTTATTAAASQGQVVGTSGPQAPAPAKGINPAKSVVQGSATTLAGGVPDDQARAIGAAIRPQSTQRKKPYYPGVTEDTIQLDFAFDATSCGVNVVNAITAAGGTLPTNSRFYRAAPTSQDGVVAETKESIDLMIRFFNDHAYDAASYAPEIRKLMGNDPTHQFFGRKLTYKLIDGGSNQCPDKTTAAARQAAESDHAFIVYNNLDGASSAGAYNMAAALNAVPPDHRPMHFGTLWLPDRIYSKFAPYAWTQFATGSTITRQLASYVCTRLVGQKASRSPDAAFQQQTRVFGLVHTNLQQDKVLADEFKGYVNQLCGQNIIAKEVEYDGQDFTKAQQNNANLITQLKLGGVTSVIMLTDPVQPLFQLQTAAGQKYYPEWIWSSFGYADSNTVQRLYDQSETAGSFGTSNLGVFGGFAFGAGDPFFLYHTYHPKGDDGATCDVTSDQGMNHPGCKAPTTLVTWYYTALPSIGGILFAGPDLTPTNVTNGLQSYPVTRYGPNGPTDDPRPALVGPGKGKHGFIVDAVEWRWRPDFKSPPPDNKDHWVEYPDCQRHYLQWPSQLAPMWERGGPNDGAWCGDATGYPKFKPDDGLH